MIAQRLQVTNEYRRRAACLESREHGIGLRAALPDAKSFAIAASVVSGRTSKPGSSALFSPASVKRSIIACIASRARCARTGPTMLAAAARTLLGALPGVARRLRRGKGGIAVKIQFGADRDVEQLAVVLATRLVQQRKAHVGFERILSASSIDTPCKLVT
jgi:hypothetical protein